MIPTSTRNTEIKTNATGDKMTMGLDAEDIQHLLPILRDSLYANKTLAPIREYSTNARDSHTARGFVDRPIRVTLPTKFEPEFRVRDFGTSLTLEEVKNTYLKYCKSTKRTSNAFNGVYGLGCKSAFAYGDMFTVITYLNGEKTIINIPISGEAMVVAQVPTDEEQGLEIVIPVAIKDVDAWHEEAMNFYAYWTVKPEIINQRADLFDRFFAPLQIKPIFSDKDWEVRPGGYNNRSKAVAVMSYVPYPINWDTVKRNFTDEQRVKYSKILGFVENNYVTFIFSNGTADFTPSREALQYTEVTVSSICRKLDKISDTIEQIITDKISTASNLWQAKCLYNQIFNGASYDKTEGNFYGNLQTIQTMLQGKLKWKGILIDNGKFENLHMWDKKTGKKDDTNRYDGAQVEGIFSTITIQDSVKKTVLQSTPKGGYRNSDIFANDKSLILIIDTEDAYKAAAGRYLFFDVYKDKDMKSIYCLDLSDAKVKKEFFKYYNFDTVPVIYASKIEAQVKAFVSANKVQRAANEQVKAPYIDMAPYYEAIKTGKDKYYIDFRWQADAVPPKDVVGGIFIQATKSNIDYLDNRIHLGWERSYRHNDSGIKEILLSFARLCLMTGKKVDRIYAIQPRTVESKWFKEEIEEGVWIELSKAAHTEFIKLDLVKAAIAMEYNDVKSSGHFMGVKAIRKLISEIHDQNSLFHQYSTLVPSDLMTYVHVPAIAMTLLKSTEVKTQKSAILEPLIKKIRAQYPMFEKLESRHSVFLDDDKTTKGELSIFAEYINAMDTFKTLKENEKVAV